MASFDLRKVLDSTVVENLRAGRWPLEKPHILSPDSRAWLREQVRALRDLDKWLFEPIPIEPIFPAFSEIQAAAHWAELWRVLDASGIHDESTWEEWSDPQKACLLNISAKMQCYYIDDTRTLFSFVESIEALLPSRTFALVDPELPDLVRARKEDFHAVPWGLHTFEGGWQVLASFKTYDTVGNLHLTFARNRRGECIADIDIDPHQGLGHWADVLLHAITREDTDPYDVLEILMRVQDIDPGYRVVRRRNGFARPN